ncbi:MAG TPA: CRTAC1 family protein, partial [Vicinamibacterales bacterium]|nr:CRTAC1 family protein [Vicinamibacterales bacterium]
ALVGAGSFHQMKRLMLTAAAAAIVYAQPASPELLFRDIAAEAGITFHHHAAPEKKYIVESISGGVAMFDYDNDGRPDLYFVDSLTVDTASDANAARSTLYRNLGNGRFEDVTDKAGVGHPGWGMGVCTADVDGDGWEDLYVTALGGSRLYHNNRNGTFTDITASAGVGVPGWSAGCGFADYDHDGRLDLFVSRYVKIDLAHLPEFGKDKTCEYRGIAVQCGPRGLRGESDYLFHNDGNGHFSDVSEKSGVSDPRGYFGLGIAWFDANGDGWPDLYVANDTTPNFLYLNQKNGTFQESAFPWGVAVSEDGAEQGGMGVALGDYDHSGRLSVFVTNFSEEYNDLYHNDVDHFTDMSFRSKTAAISLPFVGWGDAFVDYDNDTWPDIFVVNGHVYPQLDRVRMGASAGYRQRRLLYHNRGDGTFDEVAARYGTILTDEHVSRGIAVGDIDDDGRVDIAINDLDGAPQLLHNEIATRGNWLLVALKGSSPNTGAIGAEITVTTPSGKQTSVVQSGTGYISQDDKRQHFGLGTAPEADVSVKWPDGTVTTQSAVKANQVVTIKQSK